MSGHHALARRGWRARGTTQTLGQTAASLAGALRQDRYLPLLTR